MAGILPFGAMFIELFFIYNALWHNQFYYMFGFLFLGKTNSKHCSLATAKTLKNILSSIPHSARLGITNCCGLVLLPAMWRGM